MGLDMYLGLRKYVSSIDWNKVKEAQRDPNHEIDFKDYPTNEFLTVKTLVPEETLKFSESGATIKINVGYWRKANQIHGWFVRNVQKNEDDCKEHYVSRDQLIELLDTIYKVLDGDKETAKELLPVTAGFFFGNYDEDNGYDEYYYANLQHTKEMIEHLLNTVPADDYNYDFVYQSSW